MYFPAKKKQHSSSVTVQHSYNWLFLKYGYKKKNIKTSFGILLIRLSHLRQVKMVDRKNHKSDIANNHVKLIQLLLTRKTIF